MLYYVTFIKAKTYPDRRVSGQVLEGLGGQFAADILPIEAAH
jgi:hypothetical protein